MRRWDRVLPPLVRVAQASRRASASATTIHGSWSEGSAIVSSGASQLRTYSASAEQVSVADTSSSTEATKAQQEQYKRETKKALTDKILLPQYSYHEANEAHDELRQRNLRLQERHYLAIMEKANVEQRYDVVEAHYQVFCDDLEANVVSLHRAAKTAWPHLTSERVQMHRHVLWAMLHGGSTTRFRRMQRFFRRHVLNQRNQINVYESDSLNFLLRMECTLKLSAPTQGTDSANDGWLSRVETILKEMRMLRYNTSYSSSHALFHFLMHRPDVALASVAGTEATQEDTLPTQQEDTLIKVLFELMDAYRRPLDRDSRRISLAISTAASAGRMRVAIALLQDAESRSIPIDAASFAHAVTGADDEEMRMEIAEHYLRAKEHDRLYDDADNHSMKNYLLLYAVHDGNFKQLMELLHEMEFHKIEANNVTVRALFASIARYRAAMRLEETPIDQAQPACPTMLELLNDFPHVLPRTPHSVTSAVLQSLRAGDLDVARLILRTTVWSTDVVVRPEIFSQVMYAFLASPPSPTTHEATIEVEKLYKTQHPDHYATLNAQLLNLCESNQDVATMFAVLDRWQQHAAVGGPLSRRGLQRVFDIVSKQLKNLHHHDADGVRYVVQGDAELSFRAILERYPHIITLDAITLNSAVFRSVTAGLQGDAVTLLQVAHAQQVTLEPTAYKAVVELLRDQSDSLLQECIATMQATDAWTIATARYPELEELL
ncbi:hypothetical protein Poli38472_013342 [Pythium oligandrum]|uniref:Uncharacterized protein n=1 Tax=Pythium oligandrum TaxID=41045 RepID=A0A8K1FGK3_PYTOL|nr:hypothetical protein Poli38472_013342 [Pythium oligandrum]|eukprot:TMW57868.1 hypothetical protein Poli38472_013342 [Pythium oligandrum]